MDASSLRHHMDRSHGQVLLQVRGVDVGEEDWRSIKCRYREL